jgi:hypothetical protein
VNKYVDIEKRLALSEYKRNKDKKKSKRITNDIYETEDETPQQAQPIDKTQVPVDDNFESKYKGIIEGPDIEVNNEKQQTDFSPSFKLTSKRRK